MKLALLQIFHITIRCATQATFYLRHNTVLFLSFRINSAELP